jgi:hypothetical protein
MHAAACTQAGCCCLVLVFLVQSMTGCSYVHMLLHVDKQPDCAMLLCNKKQHSRIKSSTLG